MKPLLTTDWHLTDDPEDEYRWLVIDHVLHAVIQHRVDTVFVLGDVVDRKDRHSGAFVNRLINELRRIAARAYLVILRGNHDTPMRGPAFWEFLSQLHHIHYVIKPETFHLFNNDTPDLLLLPFTPQPKIDWAGFHLGEFQSLFMHATVSGAVVENGIVMENANFPILPRRCKVYSGDVHVPQETGGVVYVGAPHHIRYGDKYPCRMLLLDEDFSIEQQLIFHPPRKLMIDLTNVRQLADLKVARGDLIKIRYNCPAEQLEGWGAIERTISEWAASNGINVTGTEVIIAGTRPEAGADIGQTPEEILRQFAEHEGIGKELLEVGLGLLKEVT
jgi:hypothetical protein